MSWMKNTDINKWRLFKLFSKRHQINAMWEKCVKILINVVWCTKLAIEKWYCTSFRNALFLRKHGVVIHTQYSKYHALQTTASLHERSFLATQLVH